MRTSFILCSIFAGLLSGCARRDQTVGRVIPSLTSEQHKVAERCNWSEIVNSDSAEAKRRIEVGIENHHPVIVAFAMCAAAEWVKRGPGGAEKRDERLRDMTPLIERCVSSTDPLVRLAGVHGLRLLDDDKRLARELRRDCSFLLVRPETDVSLTGPASKEESRMRGAAVMDVGFVELCRLELIESTGRLRVREARNKLKAIAADSSRLYENSSETAKAAIARIDGLESIGYSRPTRHDYSPPPPKPEIVLGDTSRAVAPRTIMALTPAQKETCRALGVAQNDRTHDDIVRLCGDAIDTSHPAVILMSMDCAAFWAYRGQGECAKDRLAAIEPLIQRCLLSKDPLERMAGVLAIRHTEDLTRLRKEFENDASFLLVRPESALPVPEANLAITLSQRDDAKKPIRDICMYRSELIDAVGTLRVNSARDILVAIAKDASDKCSSQRHARRAIAMIDGIGAKK